MTEQEGILAVCAISASWFKFLDKKEGMQVSGRQSTDPSERRNEMKPNNMCKRSFIMAMALAAVFVIAAAWPCASSAAGRAECGLIGTWAGDAGNSLRWLGVHTPGSTLTRGEMALNWVRVLDSLLKVTVNTVDLYPNATLLTEGHGVWEMTAKGEYNYTWYAYGIEAMNKKAIYSVRVSGLATNTNLGDENINPCDFVKIDFTYEIFDGFLAPYEMTVAVPVATISAVASETRVPLTVVTSTP